MIPKLTNQEACKLALKHRLFVAGWMLNGQLHRGASRDSDRYGGVLHAAVYLEGGVPVGVAVVTHYSDIQVFVRKSERRNGIGSKLVSHMKELMGASAGAMDAGTGLVKGSRQFWNANKIRMYD